MAVLCNLARAAQVLRLYPAGALKERAASIAPGRHRLRNSLVVGTARWESCWLFGVGLSETRYDTGGQIAFRDRLLERLPAIAGVVRCRPNASAFEGTPDEHLVQH